MKINKINVVIEVSFDDGDKQAVILKVMKAQLALMEVFGDTDINVSVMREVSADEESADDLDLSSLGLYPLSDDCQCPKCIARRAQNGGLYGRNN